MQKKPEFALVWLLRGGAGIAGSSAATFFAPEKGRRTKSTSFLFARYIKLLLFHSGRKTQALVKKCFPFPLGGHRSGHYLSSLATPEKQSTLEIPSSFDNAQPSPIRSLGGVVFIAPKQISSSDARSASPSYSYAITQTAGRAPRSVPCVGSSPFPIRPDGTDTW